MEKLSKYYTAEELHRKYLNDEIIKWYNNKLGEVLSIAMPKRIFIKDNFVIEIEYSKEVTELLDKLKTDRNKYIKNNYENVTVVRR